MTARSLGLLAAAVVVVGAACTEGPGAPDPDQRSVSVFGLWRGEEARRFADTVAPFEADTGIRVDYVGSANLERDLVNRLDQGTRPDVAFVSQPGLIGRLVRSADLVPFDDDLRALVAENFDDAWTSLGQIDGEEYALWWEADVKSLVWYVPEVFAAQRYEVPETFEELIRLTDAMVEDGFSPWCVGMSDFTSTGWVATDWVEDIVLGSFGGQTYDDWVDHRVLFASEEITESLDRFGSIAREPDRIFGQVDGWLTRPVAEAVQPLFGVGDDRCLLHRQASFITTEFPEGTEIAPDGDAWFFRFPPLAERVERPLLVGGQAAVMLHDTDEARALLAYLATPESGEGWARAGGYLAPHSTFDPDVYATDLERGLRDLVDESDLIRFDASDLMPAEVGTDAFWTGMVDYIAGRRPSAVLRAIDEAWPSD